MQDPWEDTHLNHFHSVESHGCDWSELPEPVRKQQLSEAHPGRDSKGKHLASCQEERDRPAESLVQVLIFEKTSLQENKAHVTVGLSLTAAKLVKKWRRPPEANGLLGTQENVLCFYVWHVVSRQLMELCCELEN